MEERVRRFGIDYGSLGVLQRILLITDGTLTEILEAAYLEPVRLVKVSQDLGPAIEPDDELQLDRGETVMRRAILLRGAVSGRDYVHAESRVATDRLPEAFRRGLIESGEPMGRLWVSHRLETFKELLNMRLDGDMLRRRYRVLSGGRPVMVIAESFPAG